MTIQEYRQRIEKVKQVLINERPKETLIISLDLVGLIKRRIQSSGEDWKGGQFAPYTIGYKKQKEKRGAQTQFFDFTVENRAWANIRPVVTSNTEGKTEVTIEGGNQLTKDKLSGQFEKRGNILTPSQTELNLVQQANLERLQKALSEIQ